MVKIVVQLLIYIELSYTNFKIVITKLAEKEAV